MFGLADIKARNERAALPRNVSDAADGITLPRKLWRQEAVEVFEHAKTLHRGSVNPEIVEDGQRMERLAAMIVRLLREAGQ